ncbi:phosphate ABC transporter substrate-binding protein [Clostridium cellulovorans]|uniref:Phosphate-binding protein n=1 Tax=Clostridium cellulovorans (strain ATCC 35296 / DSM 3052 / OCM 3 / 743B) TaxID=573061 RepID=D9SL82_CLOC7|nr:phosphate ABC transporter substrate-binding protein [Clostridium cellulovorans]ADL51598.1 phosphate binding protein [Clostridium cellulovorans 743B]
MKKKTLLITTALMAMTMFAGVLSGCSDDKASTDNKESKTEDTNKDNSNYSGSITAAGSTALQQLVENTSKKFMDKYPDCIINVQGGGSGTGVNQVAEGNIQIGNSDVPAKDKIKDEAKAAELVDTKICAQSFAMVVSKDNKVDNLTKDQIAKIFSGEIKNWKEVGGEDVAIEIINRPATSGTRAVFTKTIMGSVAVKEDLGTAQDSSGTVVTAVEGSKGAISYLSSSYVTDKVKIKALKIDGVENTVANIAANKYPFWSYGYMVTKGEPKNEVKGFIDFLMNDTETIKSMGYIPMSELKK